MTEVTYESLTKDHGILLLYLECAATEGGVVDMSRMNVGDMQQAVAWNDQQFIDFGRIYSRDIGKGGSHWVRLSSRAADLAHRLRRERASRLWDKRTFITTEESRENH